MRLSKGLARFPRADVRKGQIRYSWEPLILNMMCHLEWCDWICKNAKQMCSSLSKVVRWNLCYVNEAAITWIYSINIKSRAGKCIRQQCDVCHGVEAMKVCQDLWNYIGKWFFQTCFPRLNESDPAQTLDRNEAVETWVLGLRSNLNGVRS